MDLQRRLSGFTLDIKFKVDHQVMVLLGRNGSGKTSTLLAIAGLLAPDKGTIRIGGYPVFDSWSKINLPPWKRGVGLVFQDLALFSHLTVFQNVAYGLQARKMNKDDVSFRVHRILKEFKIHYLRDKKPGGISGGQKQKVALARTLITSPKVLLLDEPFSALDPETRQETREEIKEILDVHSIPTILVTHDYTDALELGDIAFFLDKGRMIFTENMKDFERRIKKWNGLFLPHTIPK